MIKNLFTLALTFSVSTAIAAPETSLRPVERPFEQSSQSVAREALAFLTTAPTKLRPVLRPSGGPEVVEQVSNPAGFDNWVNGFRARARAQGITNQTLNRALRNVAYRADVVKLDRNQSEFKSQIWDYLDNAASPPRITDGQKALRKHKRVLQQIEARYGVEAEVVTAVWGLESRYGERTGDIPVMDALATLAFDGRRGKFFEAQLIGALKIIQSGDVAPRNMTGSWAGAMGHTQFIPTSYLAYAVDFTGDGKRDIWSNNPADALASTAAYLARFGWKKGQPWGVEVKLPQGFNAELANRKTKRMPSQWAQAGVVGIDGRPVRDYGSASILLPAGVQGAAFMIFNNFAVIEKYNKADAYVIGVGHLSDRIKGGPAIQKAWPRGYVPLSFDEKKELQRRLNRKGFTLEKIDGLIGGKTVGAIKAYQKSIGVNQDGFPSKQVLNLLRR